MEYQILKSAGIDALAEKVNINISSGWKPLGGVTSVVSRGRSELLQAMIKE